MGLWTCEDMSEYRKSSGYMAQRSPVLDKVIGLVTRKLVDWGKEEARNAEDQVF